MPRVPCLTEAQLQGIAQVLGECGTGSEITRVLDSRGLSDKSGHSTKWRRLDWVFCAVQREDKCANRVLDFVQAFLTPARFVGQKGAFEEHLLNVNEYLAFSGLELLLDGDLARRGAVRTLDQAERRVQKIRAKFRDRRLHSQVFKYCTSELMQENYFHAVFEATKGLAQRIREMTGAQEDGAALVDRVFSIERPLLAMNRLQTETERSQHKGLAALIKGCFAAIRNPLAHEPKIMWEGEDDAADYMSLISLLHRKLDDCFVVRQELSQ